MTTSRFGDIEFKEDMVLTFPSGIIGFPQATRYLILDHDRQAPFQWLQCIDDGSLAFVVMDPALFKSDYRVAIDQEAIAELGHSEKSELILFVILTIPSGDPTLMTANLRGPVIVNHRTRLAKQLILQEEWPTRYPLFPVNTSQPVQGKTSSSFGTCHR
ncbi:MAG: flagellar assembly protein FliW [Nitrospiraceae bacterium]